MNGNQVGEDGLGGDLSPLRSTLDDIDKANPFSIAWEWLQEQAANRRGRKYLEQQDYLGPLTDARRKKTALQNIAPTPQSPITPEEQERVQQYIQENLTSMPNMQFSEE
tara:strand:- start:1424 stop:1750 length:327 start_codon:yes stop_codon:yes gene_type:complete